MAFTYQAPVPAAAQTPTANSKSVLMKSFKIDIAAGSGGTHSTAYTLGTLPRGAQVVLSTVITTTAISGGSISASTIAIGVGGQSVVSGINTFATGNTTAGSMNYYANTIFNSSSDQTITYTYTHTTGTIPTAGVSYINVFYVV